MPGRRRLLPAGAVAGVVLLAVAAASALAVVVQGGPTPLPGPHGCLRDQAAGSPVAERCATAVHGLAGATAVAVSPRGGHLYVAARDSDAITVLTRDPRAGGIAPVALPSARGCLQVNGGHACSTTIPALVGPDALALSPNGRDVYVGSLDSAAIVALTRQHDGRLAFLRGRGRCVQGRPVPSAGALTCAERTAELTGITGLAVSPDGRNLYATSAGLSGRDDSVVALGRDPRSGALAILRGPGACVSGLHGRCARVAPTLRGPSALVVSPDGRFVYVTSQLSSSVIALARNPATGRLSAIAGPGGCAVDPADAGGGCTAAPGLGGARALALGRDGRQLYVASFDSGGVVTLQRDPGSGQLAPLIGGGGCLQSVAPSPPAGSSCATDAQLRGASALVVSASGKFVYVAAVGGNAVAVLARDAGSGGLAPIPGPTLSAPGLNGPSALARSSDGRNLYLASPFDDAVLALAVPPAIR